MSDGNGMVQVHMLQLPVPIAARAQQHFEELLREFALIQAAADDEEGAERPVPQRLMELVDVLTQQFGGLNDGPQQRLEDAIARGDATIDDHVLEVPPAAGPASQALGDMIDEADEYCRRGQHLLTLSTPEDCVTYRRWYLGQVVGQLEGSPPVSWPDYERQLQQQAG